MTVYADYNYELFCPDWHRWELRGASTPSDHEPSCPTCGKPPAHLFAYRAELYVIS